MAFRHGLFVKKAWLIVHIFTTNTGNSQHNSANRRASTQKTAIIRHNYFIFRKFIRIFVRFFEESFYLNSTQI